MQVHVLRQVGHFVPAGTPLLLASKPERLTGDVSRQFRAVFDIGPSRTLQQEVEFGALQIVDIALRAISPAVNDPTSAISCIDQLSRIMIRFASRDPVEPLFSDPPGVVRVSIPWISFEGLLNSAFEQIRLYAKGDVAVSLRLLRALTDVASTTPNSDYLESMVEMGKRVVAGCAERLAENELKDLRLRQENSGIVRRDLISVDVDRIQRNFNSPCVSKRVIEAKRTHRYHGQGGDLPSFVKAN